MSIEYFIIGHATLLRQFQTKKVLFFSTRFFSLSAHTATAAARSFTLESIYASECVIAFLTLRQLENIVSVAVWRVRLGVSVYLCVSKCH